ncbi:DL-endopeptidase inhibitor IseA family protein [Rossellomorea aquimaris]|uniref:Uncharacterized protein n=1 Tax=Rossellomorea aquimaris TaxID=189382 RepID=A0A5D4TTM1_9BACI|nr:DL-endopeptidase inhibitor IseA family protein [Rossellomorea aquimaris]TYS78171.1 hypothetical protein FZC80_13135 [Rossellomorea aquimaris]
MKKREVDHFLQPLKNRPDSNPRKGFQEELHHRLISGQLKEQKTRHHSLLPNLAAALLLVVAAVFISREIILSDQQPDLTAATDNQDVPISESIADITEKEAVELIGTAFAHYSIVVNGGGPNMGDVFKYDGMEYRYMGDDFQTKGEVLSFLQEKYSEEISSAIFAEIPFRMVNDKLAQPNKLISGDLLWADGEILSYKKDGQKARRIEYKVQRENSENFSLFELTLRYEDGWKLDEKLPFSYGDNLGSSNEQGTEIPYDSFSLTESEQAIYDYFSADFNEEHLRNLDPVSIAKLYVQAGLENNHEAEYALFTDREEYVRWTKEEHLEISLKEEVSQKELLDIFNGIQNGKFIEKNENHGYIEFNNNGLKGFQMVKDKDGIWNVGFMPIQ